MIIKSSAVETYYHIEFLQMFDQPVDLMLQIGDAVAQLRVIEYGKRNTHTLTAMPPPDLCGGTDRFQIKNPIMGRK